MNTLEKKLVKIAEKSKDDSESVVNEAKLLLASNVAEERTLLAQIGLDNDLKVVEDKNGEVITRNAYGNRLGKTILHFNDIKKLCLNYRLYMRKANKYVGTIPPELGSELNRFCKEKSVVVPAHSDHSNFYIIAPPIMFKGYKSPVNVFLEAIDYADEQAAERERLKRLDPILVYKVDQDHYAIVKSWGSDFTPLRRLYGFFTTIKAVKFLNFFTSAMLMVGLFKLGMWQMKYLGALTQNARVHGQDGSGWEVLSVFVWLGLIVVAGVWIFAEYFKDIRKSIIKDVTSNEQDMKRYGQVDR